ncbi:MAG: sulfatase [Verrucomicrobiales bacterium]|nr:sulfatase [Verrucomicrobiales bacterium]
MKAAILTAVLTLLSFANASAKPKNVILIVADDLGWADTTLYGHTSFYETPNLERLASRGMTFSRAYSNSPLCSPTRASILTGQTPARHGSTAPQHHTGEVRLKASVDERSRNPGNKAMQTNSVTRLDPAYPTLGKLMKKDGYATGHFGKWHLGPEPYSPLEHGFDVDIPHHPGPGPAGSFVAPWKYKSFEANEPQEHIEDRMALEAVQWLKTRKKDTPWFMNYWMFSVHAPFDAKKALIEDYRSKVDPKDAQRSPTYAAMVHSMDDAVGTLLDAVDQAGVAEDTIIIFTSDNGGNMYNEVDGTTPTSNSPLRGGKATMFEGGIRVPTIVAWPGVTQPGSRSEELIQTSDFYPTLLNQLEIAIPEDHVVDAVDIMPALRGKPLDREAIFTYFPHNPPVPDWLPPSIAVHCGDWKLIRIFHEGEKGAHAYRLYHLKEDIGETENLAQEMPDKVEELDQLIEGHIEETKAVVPIPNPEFDPAKYRPERIGVPAVRNKKKKPAPKKTAIGGWTASGTSSIKRVDKQLQITSSGRDPYITASPFPQIAGGPFTLQIRMKSDANGQGAVYYNRPPSADRMPQFPIQHDGEWHEYEIPIPSPSLNLLRIDPARGTGTILIEWIRLVDADGKNVKSWEF